MKPDDKFAWLGYALAVVALLYFTAHVAAHVAANI